MQKLYCLFIVLSLTTYGQISKDTLTDAAIEKDTIVTVNSSWYARTMFAAMTTGSDTTGETLSQRMTQNIEFGRSIGSVDLGLAYGEFYHSVIDSSRTRYAQLRVTMDACQLGIFSNEISVGAGCVFNSKAPIMMEISSTLFAQIHENFGLGFVFGNTDFVGNYNDMNKSFFGLYLRYGLERNEGGILTNKLRIFNHIKNHNHRKRMKLL